jgi:hypothetical protein
VKSQAPQRKVQIIFTAKNNVNVNIVKTCIRDSVVEAPRDEAKPPQAQSIRGRRFGSLMCVKSKAPKSMMTPRITAKNNANINIEKNYFRDPDLEAPRGAAEPPQAQSIRSRRFGSLYYMKSNAPKRMMEPTITAKNKSNIQTSVKLTSEIQ